MNKTINQKDCSECIWRYIQNYGDYPMCEMSGDYCNSSFIEQICPYYLHSRKELKEIIKEYNIKKGLLSK